MTDRQFADPAEAFAQLGRIKLAETDLNGVLQLIAELAKRTVPGAEDTSVTLIRGETAHTTVCTSDFAKKLDEWQYQEGAGPCLDASAGAATLSVPVMSAEDRWPEWAVRAFTAGVQSSLSIGLPVQDTVNGALNIYATKPEAFDAEAIELGQTFAGYAAVALANAHLYDATATLAEQMRTAMESRAVIEQAKGIIMGDQRCTADEAFRILTKMSRDTNRKLRDVAALIVSQAERPPRR